MVEVPKKLGRPTEPNAKRHDIKVRVNDETYNQLIEYAAQHQTTKAEVVRTSLEKFLKESGNK